MIIQWEFRFPVLRIFRDLWDSKAMGTGSKDANGMPIEFSLQLAFCWQVARAKCMCHSTSFGPFHSQDSDALCNHEGPPLRRASVPPRERTCQDPAIRGYWMQIRSSWYWQRRRNTTSTEGQEIDMKGLNLSPRICKVKATEAKNLHNTHPQLTTPDNPTKEGPALRLLWRIQTAVAYQILFDWCNIINASKAVLLPDA